MDLLLNGLDLFSGIGGITLALRPWVKPIAYCEIDRYAQSVLLSRISEGLLPDAPIWDDVKTLQGTCFDMPVDIIYGGFPCQDISAAGIGKGLDGERSGLFFQILRLVNELKPRFIFLENVPAIRTKGLSRIGQELANAGYDCRWTTLSAYDMGAPQKRTRWFCLAHARSAGLEGIQQESGKIDLQCLSGNVQGEDIEKWDTEPDVVRVANGLPYAAHRIKCLGNSVVFVQARKAFMILSGMCDLKIVRKSASSQTRSVIRRHWKTNNKISCVDSYKLAVIDWLNSQKIDYLWQHKKFLMLNGKLYIPDLFLLDENKWIEIKGYFRSIDKEKWEWFHKEYPNSELWNRKILEAKDIDWKSALREIKRIGKRSTFENLVG